MVRRFLMQVAMLALIAAPVSAQYSVARPTPRDKMRDMTTDRPDRTESPVTVDAGHVQLEMDAFTYTRDRLDRSTVSESWAVAPINLKLGLTDAIDLQFVAEPFTGSRVTVGGAGATERGAGEFSLRAKFNLWGNDGGKTAFGLMPFVTSAPTSAGRKVQGGLILPLAVELAEGWGLGTMLETDFIANDGRSGHSVVVISSVTLGRDLSDRLGMYGEFYNEASRGPWIGTVDAGITWAVTPNLQLDGGANIGISRAADGINPFVGLSIRF